MYPSCTEGRHNNRMKLTKRGWSWSHAGVGMLRFGGDHTEPLSSPARFAAQRSVGRTEELPT